MNKLAFCLLVAVVMSALHMVRVQHEARRLFAELAGADAVNDGRGTAALNMTEHGDARLNICMLCDVVTDILSLCRPLGNDNEDIAFAALICGREAACNLLQIELFLGNENVLRPARNA